jgi:hypothetical protein
MRAEWRTSIRVSLTGNWWTNFTQPKLVDADRAVHRLSPWRQTGELAAATLTDRMAPMLIVSNRDGVRDFG